MSMSPEDQSATHSEYRSRRSALILAIARLPDGVRLISHDRASSGCTFRVAWPRASMLATWRVTVDPSSDSVRAISFTFAGPFSSSVLAMR